MIRRQGSWKSTIQAARYIFSFGKYCGHLLGTGTGHFGGTRQRSFKKSRSLILLTGGSFGCDL